MLALKNNCRGRFHSIVYGWNDNVCLILMRRSPIYREDTFIYMAIQMLKYANNRIINVFIFWKQTEKRVEFLKTYKFRRLGLNWAGTHTSKKGALTGWCWYLWGSRSGPTGLSARSLPFSWCYCFYYMGAMKLILQVLGGGVASSIQQLLLKNECSIGIKMQVTGTTNRNSKRTGSKQQE